MSFSNLTVIAINSSGRYADRVDYYSQLSGLVELERLDTSFVTAALNSEQIFNTGRLLPLLNALSFRSSRSFPLELFHLKLIFRKKTMLLEFLFSRFDRPLLFDRNSGEAGCA